MTKSTNNMTIVTAFINNVNVRNDRTLEHYMEYGKHLLNVNLPKIIFIDTQTYHVFFKDAQFPLTHFVLFDKEDMYFQKYKNKTENFYIITNNTEKDTIDFVFVQCMKTEWVKKAIELDVFQTEQFVWVDFGIMHFIQDPIVLEKGLQQMNTKTYQQIRIPSGKPPNFPYYSRNVYHHIIWMFIGSVFGGNKQSLISFADLMKEKCVDILERKHHLMWEINVWYLIFFENVKLFDLYRCNHTPNILFDY